MPETVETAGIVAVGADRSLAVRISEAVLTVGLLTAAVSAANLGKDLLIAAYYGPGDRLDAFLIAFAPLLFVINTGAVCIAGQLIPSYITTRRRDGAAAARRLLTRIGSSACVLLAILSVLLAIGAPLIVPAFASRFETWKLHLSQELFYLMLPIVLLSGLAALWGAVLQSEERFSLVSVAAFFIPLSIGLAALGGGASWGIHALAIGTLVGFAIQAALLGLAARPYGVSFRCSWREISASLRELLPQYLPLIFAAALVNRGLLIDQAVAATLTPGSVAAFTLGSKLVGFVQGLGATALRAAVLPYFATMVAEGNWRGLRRTSVTITVVTLVICAPAMLVLALWAEPLVRLVYQRGAFTADDTTLVAYVHAISVLQIPFFMLFGLVAPLISALNANRYLVRVTVIAFPLNALLDYVLSLFFGLAGIVIATTIVSFVTWAYLMKCSHQAIRRSEDVSDQRCRPTAITVVT